MKKIWVIKTGQTFPVAAKRFGDFEQWIFSGAHPQHAFERNTTAVFLDQTLPDLSQVDAVIITGSPAMVTDRAPWMEQLAEWLRQLVAANTPILGICFGHQILAHALGGVVDYHPKGRELGTVGVTLLPESKEDSLFKNLPNDFSAHVSHKQTVLTLPQNAVRLACNDFEPHHAFRVGSCAWGLQFHPEFTEEVMKEYIDYFSGHLESEGLDKNLLLSKISKTPASAKVLENFFTWVLT